MNHCQRNENLQKDKIIASLQEELGMLRESANNIASLEEEVSKIGRRCQRIETEKERAGHEFKCQTDIQMKAIQEAKLELEELRRIHRRQILEGEELVGEESVLRDVCFRREEDSNIARSNLRDIMVEENELKEEQRHLRQVVLLFERQKHQTLAGLNQLEGVYKQDQEGKKAAEQAVMERAHLLADLEATIHSLQESIQMEAGKITGFECQGGEIARQINQQRQSIHEVQRKLNQLSSGRDSFRSKSNYYKLQLDQEEQKRNEQLGSLHSLELSIAQSEKYLELAEGQRDDLFAKNEAVLKANEQLIVDLDLTRSHLHALREANLGLLAMLQRHCQEDLSISQLIDRQERIRQRRARIEDSQAKLHMVLDN